MADIARSGRRLSAGFRDGVDLHAAVILATIDQADERRKVALAKLAKYYSPHGMQLEDVKAAFAEIGTGEATAPSLIALRPEPSWVVAQLLGLTCHQHQVAERAQKSAAAKVFDVKDKAKLCDRPLEAFREAYAGTMRISSPAGHPGLALFNAHLKGR